MIKEIDQLIIDDVNDTTECKKKQHNSFGEHEP